MHFPRVSDSSILEKISDSETFSKFFLSPKISRFSSAKISDYFFLSSTTNFEFPLYFPCFIQYISSCFAKIIITPYFEKFPLCFRKIHLLFTYFMCISFPPTLTMMHLCITQCTYWTPLSGGICAAKF